MSKTSTLLTGLKVAARPHRELTNHYEKIIDLLQSLPKNYIYRVQMEKTARERIDLINANPDIGVVEQKINQGQVEEVILQAQKEIEMIKQLKIYKPWEELIEEPPAHQWTWPPHK